MKFKTTKAAINNGYYYKICIGYCDLQYLLNYENPVAYTCGIYGWNADIYDLSDITGYNACIVTGYRPWGNIRADYSRNRAAEEKAEKIVHDYKRDIDERKAELKNILRELALTYIDELKKAEV